MGIQTRVADTPRHHLTRIDDFQNGRLNGRASPFNIGWIRLITHCLYHDYRSFVVRTRVGKFVGYQSVCRLRIKRIFFQVLHIERDCFHKKKRRATKSCFLRWNLNAISIFSLVCLMYIECDRSKSSFVLSHTLYLWNLRNLEIKGVFEAKLWLNAGRYYFAFRTNVNREIYYRSDLIWIMHYLMTNVCSMFYNSYIF